MEVSNKVEAWTSLEAEVGEVEVSCDYMLVLLTRSSQKIRMRASYARQCALCEANDRCLETLGC